MGAERPPLRTTFEVTCDAASGGKAPFVVPTQIANRRATGNGADGRVRGDRATAGPELTSGWPRVRPSPKPANATLVAPRVGCRARLVSVRNICRWDSTVRSATACCLSRNARRLRNTGEGLSHPGSDGFGPPCPRRGHLACRKRTALVDTRVFSMHLLLPLKYFNNALL